MVGGALVLGIVAAYVAVNFYRDSVLRPRMAYVARDRAYLSSLTAHDDYDAVVRKLGPPALDRWQGPPDGPRYRALSYPDRGCTIVLMAPAGGGGETATYLGALDANWKPLYAVGPPLRALPRF
jgi:hypothetical protein